jgi:succinoglycan biosynthesis transport protein ExoP
MSPYDSRSIVDDAVRGEAGSFFQFDVSDMLGIIRRGWFYIVLGTLIGIGSALAALSAMSPLYKAEARIVFERTVTKYLQTNRVIDGPAVDDGDIWGQIYIISSEANVLPVVRSLGLANDPEFNGIRDEANIGLMDRMRGLVREARHYIFGGETLPAVAPDPEKVALASVLVNLSVTRGEVPALINVAFSSKDPVKSARIANAIAEAYLKGNATIRINSTQMVGRLVQDRVTELKQQAADAERALLEYRMANNLIGSGSNTLSGDQLTSLQTHLAAARVAMAEAKARVDRIKAAEGPGGVFAPDNELISRLRTQHLELASRVKDIESRVGPGHLAAVKMRARMEEVQAAIADEQKRLAGTFDKEYELARARYDELAATVSQVLTEEGSNTGVQARIKELQSAADTLRALYNKMLERASDMDRLYGGQLTSPAPDARIVTHAQPPQQTEASKKRLLIFAGGSILGFLLGGVLLLARDFPFGVFRTPQQVNRATGLACAVLPRIGRRRDQAALKGGEYALNTPYSRFAETLRSIWALINIAQRENGAKVICVVSSVPGEGKTTVATNLASHFSCHTSARVLLIDADLHRHSLTDRVAPEASVGLKEALGEPAELSKYVVHKERLQLDVLPCPLPSRIPNAAELLGTPAMQKLIDTAREAYDLVVIEAPPVAAVVDFKMISRHCDGFIFVVEWGRTSQRLVMECLGEGSEFLDRILCVVLNKFDPRALKSVERYKGHRFTDYYTDKAAA